MITRDDWLLAMKEAIFAPLPETDALSIKELADLFQCQRNRASQKVQILVSAGLAEETTKLVRRSNGGVVRIPAYRLLDHVKARNGNGGAHDASAKRSAHVRRLRRDRHKPRTGR